MSFQYKATEPYDKNKIVEMLSDGKTGSQIAAYYGVSRQRITQVFEKFGLKNPVKERSIQRQEAYKQKLYERWGDKDQIEYKEKWRKYKNKETYSKQRGIDFDLHFNDIEWPTHCPILGFVLDYCADTRKENSPSFDRIDPTIGYVKGNVHIISWRANRIKNDGTSEELRKIADYLDKNKILL